ncbi:MAG: DUF1638 domain-containing protein [Acetobacterium sp.]
MVFVACAILEEEIKCAMKELGIQDEVIFIDPALHVDEKRLEAGLIEKLNEAQSRNEKIGLLIGTKCHPGMMEIAKKYEAKIAPNANCAELLLGDKMKELDSECNSFYLSDGWLKNWRRIFIDELKWDACDARQNFGLYERIVFVDTGVGEVSDEDQFDFFEYTQVPIEPYETSLDHFKAQIKSLDEA